MCIPIDYCDLTDLRVCGLRVPLDILNAPHPTAPLGIKEELCDLPMDAPECQKKSEQTPQECQLRKLLRRVVKVFVD